MRSMSIPSALSRFSTAGVDSAITNTTSPPLSCQAWARARQRMTWPVAMFTFASARIINKSAILSSRFLEHGPLKSFTGGQVVREFSTDHFGYLIRQYRIRWSRTQSFQHCRCENRSGLQVVDGPQCATLHHHRLALIFGEELDGRT